MNKQRLIDISIALKSKADNFRAFHVTFIYYKSRPLAIATNKPYCTHPKNLKYPYMDKYGNFRGDKVGLHSEMAALIKLGLDDCRHLTFYVVRLDKNNIPRYSKPCSGCSQVLSSVGFKNVWYTTDYGWEKL